MWLLERCPWWTSRWIAAVLLVGMAPGCKSDLNQQLLERELRYQEDQIYQLQDELQDTCSRLESLTSENTSLRRQLGVGENDPLSRTRPLRPTPATAPPAVTVPPAIEIPGGSPPPVDRLAPPALDNIPPLPVKPSGAEPPPLSLPAPLGGASDAAPPPVAVPVAYDPPVADTRPVRLVVNTRSTACFDADGDGHTDGVAVTFEPRDADERLVPAAGSVSITIFDTVDPTAVLGEATLSTEQALAEFRPTTRRRGVHVPVRWTAGPPAGDHVRALVRVTAAEGAVLETDATIPAR
ncbi:MAG: hypothetical protein ACKOC8_06255 [Pirellulales bacterium]